MCAPPQSRSRWVPGHTGAAERAGKDGQQEAERPTCPNDFFNLHEGHIDLLGELSDGFVGVLVGEGVDVDLHPRRPLLQGQQGQQQKGENYRNRVNRIVWVGRSSKFILYHPP